MAVVIVEDEKRPLVDQLVQHVKDSVDAATKHVSKLRHDVLALPGMSSPKVRHFLNNLCSRDDTKYLEIGLWQGSTFIAAIFGNMKAFDSCTAIDNFSEFSGPRAACLQNLARLLGPSGPSKLIDQDCWSVDLKRIASPVTVYFFDGAHDEESQRKAFTHFNEVFADHFIAVVDDWNCGEAQRGTKRAFQELGYKVVYEVVLPARYNGDTDNWWNGLYVAVISKH